MTPGEACESIRAHLARGAPWDACDTFRDAFANDPGNAELLYWGALAHARAGAGSRAHALLDEAQKSPRSSAVSADILSLRGRLWKDAYGRAPERAAATAVGQRARDEYLAAFTLARDPYPGVNAATLSMLLGDRDAARALRERLAGMHLPVVYTSAACGADLIFLEAALDIGAEVNVVLPFDREDFIRTSVAPGGDRWTSRFDHVLSRATRVIMATEERYLGDDVLFEHAAMVL